MRPGRRRSRSLFVRIAVGEVGRGWWVLLPLLAAVAAAATGARLASRSTDPRRTPANRTARRRAGPGTTAAARPVRVSSAHGCRAVLRRPAATRCPRSGRLTRRRRVLRRGGPWRVRCSCVARSRSRRPCSSTPRDGTSGGVIFFVAARVREAAARALPLLVIMVTVAQLAFALTLTSTEQRGQAAGALAPSVETPARPCHPGPPGPTWPRVAAAPGVRAAVAARVEDEVRATSRERRRRAVGGGRPARLRTPPLGEPAARRTTARRLGATGAPASRPCCSAARAGLRDGLTVPGSGGPSDPAARRGHSAAGRGHARAGRRRRRRRLAAPGSGRAQHRMGRRTGRGIGAPHRGRPPGSVVVYADALAARRAAPLVRV